MWKSSGLRCRMDKKEWFELKGNGAQEVFCRIVIKLTGTRINTNVPIKDKTVRLRTVQEEQNTKWIEHFRDTLNQTRLPPMTLMQTWLKRSFQ